MSLFRIINGSAFQILSFIIVDSRPENIEISEHPTRIEQRGNAVVHDDNTVFFMDDQGDFYSVHTLISIHKKGTPFDMPAEAYQTEFSDRNGTYIAVFSVLSAYTADTLTNLPDLLAERTAKIRMEKQALTQEIGFTLEYALSLPKGNRQRGQALRSAIGALSASPAELSADDIISTLI